MILKILLTVHYGLPRRDCPSNYSINVIVCYSTHYVSAYQQNALLLYVSRGDGLVVVVYGCRHLVAVQSAIRQEVVLQAQTRLFRHLRQQSREAMMPNSSTGGGGVRGEGRGDHQQKQKHGPTLLQWSPRTAKMLGTCPQCGATLRRVYKKVLKAVECKQMYGGRLQQDHGYNRDATEPRQKPRYNSSHAG